MGLYDKWRCGLVPLLACDVLGSHTAHSMLDSRPVTRRLLVRLLTTLFSACIGVEDPPTCAQHAAKLHRPPCAAHLHPVSRCYELYFAASAASRFGSSGWSVAACGTGANCATATIA